MRVSFSRLEARHGLHFAYTLVSFAETIEATCLFGLVRRICRIVFCTLCVAVDNKNYYGAPPPFCFLCVCLAYVFVSPFLRPQSTKMEALMEEVHLMMERDPAAKAIVFSQVCSCFLTNSPGLKRGGAELQQQCRW